MLFRKYDIVIFKDSEGVCRKMRIRGWMGFLLFGLFISLIAGNIYFWNYFTSHGQLEHRLHDSEKTVEEQKSQLLNLANKLKALEKDLARIRDFDSKLRVMINLDEEIDTDSVGGQARSDFSDSYLPVYRQELLARNMHGFLETLSTEVQLEEVRQEELLEAFEHNLDLLSATPTIWPTEGWVTSPFGRRISPFTGQSEFHQGIDISGKVGTPIYAPATGVVTFTGVDGGFGKTIVLKHGSGIVTRYCHLHRVSVDADQEVQRGELIGYLGNTGRSTGPHLHYEVRLNGVCVDPMRYILN